MSTPSPDATLRGRWLHIARVVWVVVALLYVGVFVSGIPSEFARLNTPCTGPVSCNLLPHLTVQKAQALRELNLSVNLFAAYFVAVEIVFTAVWAAVGALIFWRRSNDRMAFLVSFMLLTCGAAIPIPLFTLDLSPFWTVSARVVGFLGAASFALFAYVFPDGRFVPRWSRWLALAAVGVVTPTSLFPHSVLSLWRHPLLNALVSFVLVGVLLFLQGYRYTRVSDATQRQQTKWVVLGLVVALGGFLVFPFVDALFPGGLLASLLANTAYFVLMLFLPISIAIAILRYRLYEIDLLINRTLVYGALTAVLALVYFGGIAATQAVFRALTGQEEQPQLAIVVSTLVIAALFNPLRRRIQSFIDRRFYRSKYDATKTLEAFSAKLRDETDLDALSDDLVGVVRETMQPAHISLWLRPDLPLRGGEEQE
jgi:hypothetical protein